MTYHCDGWDGREGRGRRSSGDGKGRELRSGEKKRTGKRKIWTRRPARNFQNAKTCRQLPPLPRVFLLCPWSTSVLHLSKHSAFRIFMVHIKLRSTYPSLNANQGIIKIITVTERKKK